MKNHKRTMLRERDGLWCKVTVELRECGCEGEEDLAIIGDEGHILTPAQAKREALEYWRSYFDDNPAEIIRLGRRTAGGAAKHVIETDGKYHGLDIDHESDDGKKIYIVTGCGQIRETIAEWFPEVVPYFKWHLNRMHAECEHQEARGEGIRTHLSAICPDCGWKLGEGWSSRKLPPEVLSWAIGDAALVEHDRRMQDATPEQVLAVKRLDPSRTEEIL